MARVFVITGPSGVGKGTLIRTLRERCPSSSCRVSATTRAPRPGEEDGVDYHFLSDDGVRRAGSRRATSSSTPRYSGRRYGTLRSELERRLARGRPVVLEIEVQGARQVREAMPEAVQIFIAPPSRGGAARAAGRPRHRRRPRRSRRACATAREELAAQDEFAHVVVNDRLEDAVDDARATRRVGAATG